MIPQVTEQQMADAGLALHTRSVYMSALNSLGDWIVKQDWRHHWDATNEGLCDAILSEHIKDRGGKNKTRSTMRQVVSAIKWVHRYLGMPDPYGPLSASAFKGTYS